MITFGMLMGVAVGSMFLFARELVRLVRFERALKRERFLHLLSQADQTPSESKHTVGDIILQYGCQRMPLPAHVTYIEAWDWPVEYDLSRMVWVLKR